MIIIGINNMHDASAVLVIDGKLVAAAEEERFTRVKHMRGFPKSAMKFCLDFAGITIKDVDIVCASWNPWALRVRVTHTLKSIIKSPQIFKVKASRGIGQLQGEWAELFRLRKIIEDHFGRGKYKVEFVDHHLSHAASAFLCSPFDRAAILTVDGAGEADTTVMWIGEGTKIRRIKSIKLPHSLGHFYSAVTAFLGFEIQSDEYKVMGLASYGKPNYADYLRKHVIKLLPNGLFRLASYFIDYHSARKGIFRKDTIDVFGEPRRRGEEVNQQHADVAASAQTVIEEAILHMANYLYEMTQLDTLCMAGGVAFNCVANGKLFKRTRFKDVFIQPAAGDAGSALGAPFLLENNYSGGKRKFVMEHAYWGPSVNSSESVELLKYKNIPCKILTEDILLKTTARALADGKIVCWIQGRMEWGPRALGNRSFLADPRREGMKDVINIKIKKREPFRPFAPSVLEESGSEYFDLPGTSPYMLFACDVKHDKKKEIPAVTHVDGTARPQTVDRKSNPLYWNLIKEFEKITDVPVLLNTSFNIQEPIVCTPEDSIQSFLSTKADCLVMNNLFVERLSQ